MSDVEELVCKLTRPAEILLVEDDDGAGSVLVQMLTRTFNCCVTWATDGEEALRRLSDRNFDLVLLDLMLPTLSSEEVMREIKRRKASLPVVLVTGWPGSDAAVKVARLGAVGLVVKPFTVRDLDEMFRIFKIRAVKRPRPFDRSSGSDSDASATAAD